MSAFLGDARRLAPLGAFASLGSDFPFRDHDRDQLVTGRSAGQWPLGWGNEDDWILAATPRGGARRLSPRSLPLLIGIAGSGSLPVRAHRIEVEFVVRPLTRAVIDKRVPPRVFRQFVALQIGAGPTA